NCQLKTTANPDRENCSLHNITIALTDMGTPQRTTQRSFFITIADQNDNTPAFASASFAASVAEESA
ncbi:hypothetical protein BOX15_Mlig004429g3, partial [Macrostomum lignano]